MHRQALTCFPLFLFHLGSAKVTDFTNVKEETSVGGKATCLTGPLKVSVKATNTKLLYENPKSQAMLTNTINEFLVPGGNFTTVVMGGPNKISDTYRIESKLCWPRHSNLNSIDSIQLLTHGGSLTKFYWEIAPEFSFIDAAADAGYATFSYDRLGNGDSERPDPIQIVQGSVQVEILHELTQALRGGVIGDRAFTKVIGNSHSMACLMTIGQANRYPKDLDGIVLSGTSICPDYVGATLAGPAYISARDDEPKFKGLPSGYISYVGAQAMQLLFFKYPYYDEKIFSEFVRRKNTAALGEFFTCATLATPAYQFTGPVFVVNGEADFPFCGGNCFYPVDQTAEVASVLFPAAALGSAHHTIPQIGHLIFAHNRAASAEAFSSIIEFLEANSLGAKRSKQQ